MPAGQISLLFIFLLGLVSKNNILTSAAGILLIMQGMGLDGLFLILEDRAIDVGLLFLTMAILVPFATGKIHLRHIIEFLCSRAGLLTMVGGAAAAILNARGVKLLSGKPQVIGAIILGCIISIAFGGGIPVGPIMAAGIASVLLQLFRYFL
ncbi:MAG: DUF441 domain-containing protein [Firmicutes bacterium]|nr:DUF441 domain-containing protein [Bacillota bacterium]